MPRPRLCCCLAQGVCAEGFRPPPPLALSLSDPPWTHGRPCYQLCLTHGASACCFWTWRRRCHHIAMAGALRCHYLPLCSAVGPTSLLSSARLSACLHRRRVFASWLLRRWVGLCPLPAPIRLLPGLHSVAVVPLGVLSPRCTSANPGVSVPCGESTPPSTPWCPPWCFPPLRRPQ